MPARKPAKKKPEVELELKREENFDLFGEEDELKISFTVTVSKYQVFTRTFRVEASDSKKAFAMALRKCKDIPYDTILLQVQPIQGE